MTLLSNEQKVKLKKLFDNKKYSELELEIEFISDFKTRSAFLANLLGVTKLKKVIKSDKDWSDARDLFFDAHEKDPNYIDALCNYAHISVKLRDYNAAKIKLLNFKKKGYNPKINEALARIYFFEGEIDKEVDLFKENQKNGDLNKTAASHLLTSMNYSSNFDQKDYLEYCKKIDHQFKISQEIKDKLEKFDFDKKIVIGFVSPDFREHSIYYFLKATIDELKKNSFKVVAFNIRDPNELDKISHKLKKQFYKWIDINHLNDFDAANEIRKNKINILIDVSGHFARNRFTLFKYRPAPVQVSWMGYVNTTGISEIDYILADHNLIKPTEEKMYSEKVIRLPDIWSSHMGIVEKVDSNDPPFLKNGFLTFGCFNNSSKISENCIDVWSQILNEIRDAKLIIKASSKDSEIAQDKILSKFKNKKINENRIIFEKHKLEREDHLKMYHNIDISLDTFPYPGVTTSFESIWMGVPVLTKKGNNFVSRCGESINANLELKEFLAVSDEDYIKKAISFNKNKDIITQLRSSLRDKSIKSPLFDTVKFGTNFSDKMHEIWHEYESQNNVK
tara:strand:- start:2474 stop:4162 length:1689 start_codon:yes stop_codon:yes gene_type:complete